MTPVVVSSVMEVLIHTLMGIRDDSDEEKQLPKVHHNQNVQIAKIKKRIKMTKKLPMKILLY